MKYLIEVDAMKLLPGSTNEDETECPRYLVTFPGDHQMMLPAAVFEAITDTKPGTLHATPLNSVRGPGLDISQLAMNSIVRAAVTGADLPPVPPADKPNPLRGTPDPDVNDTTTVICIECGESTKVRYPSGKCPKCAVVKCPSCRSAVRAIQIVNRRCPKCVDGQDISAEVPMATTMISCPTCKAWVASDALIGGQYCSTCLPRGEA